MGDFCDEGVAHAERAMPVGHAVCGPSLREALELIQLVGYETTKPAILHHDVLGSACPGTALPGENGSARSVKGIGECDGALRIRVLVTGLRGALLALAALEILPCRQMCLVNPVFCRHLVGGHKVLTERVERAVVHGIGLDGEHMPIDHDARILERAGLLALAEGLGRLVRVDAEFECPGYGVFLRRYNRERAREHTRLEQTGMQRFCGRLTFGSIRVFGVDIHATAALGHAVFGGVDYMPFSVVAKTVETGQDDGKVTAALAGGGFQQPVDVFEQHETGMAHLQQTVDAPPQDALLPVDARCHGQRLGDRIVLAGEPAHEHVELGNLPCPGFNLIEGLGDILVDNRTLAEPVRVASRGELLALLPVGLPVVRPHRLERAGGILVEFGMLRVVVSVQAEAETAHAREQLGNTNSLVHQFHAPVPVRTAILC